MLSKRRDVFCHAQKLVMVLKVKLKSSFIFGGKQEYQGKTSKGSITVVLTSVCKKRTARIYELFFRSNKKVSKSYMIYKKS